MWMLSLMTCARWMPLSRLLAPQRAPHCRANAPRLVPFMHTHHFNLNLSLFCSLSLSLTHKRRAERHTRRGGCTSQTHTHTRTHAAQQGKHAEASALHFAHSSIYTWPSPHEHTPSPRSDTSSALSTSFASATTRALKLLSRAITSESLYKCPESPVIRAINLQLHANAHPLLSSEPHNSRHKIRIFPAIQALDLFPHPNTLILCSLQKP